MAAGDLRDQIARLEADIEELADSLIDVGRPCCSPRLPSLAVEFACWPIS